MLRNTRSKKIKVESSYYSFKGRKYYKDFAVLSNTSTMNIEIYL